MLMLGLLHLVIWGRKGGFSLKDRLFIRDTLQQWYDELEPLEFYRAIFPEGELAEKGQQITGARKSIGKGSNDQSPYMEKVNDGMTVLSALTSWALEGGVITGDSMRSRGYGCGKRTSFQLYSMTGRDRVLIILMVPLLTIVLITIITGGTAAAFTPDLQIAPVKGPHVWGLVAYGAYLSIPIVLQMKEAVQWRISRSRI